MKSFVLKRFLCVAALFCGQLEKVQAMDGSWAVFVEPTTEDRELLKRFASRVGRNNYDVDFSVSNWRNDWRAKSDDDWDKQSCRRPENIVSAREGVKLLTAHDPNCKAPYSTGYIYSAKTFSYGYFSSRLEFGGVSGLNNAFWLAILDNNGNPAYEIDCVEGHAPNIAVMSLHFWAGKHKSISKSVQVGEQPTRTMHNYSAIWTPQRIIIGIDGDVRAAIDAKTYGKAEARFSTAIIPWAGELKKSPIGSAMTVQSFVYQSLDGGEDRGAQ